MRLRRVAVGLLPSRRRRVRLLAISVLPILVRGRLPVLVRGRGAIVVRSRT